MIYPPAYQRYPAGYEEAYLPALISVDAPAPGLLDLGT